MYKFIGNNYPNITYTDQKFLVMYSRPKVKTNLKYVAP